MPHWLPRNQRPPPQQAHKLAVLLRIKVEAVLLANKAKIKRETKKADRLLLVAAALPEEVVDSVAPVAPGVDKVAEPPKEVRPVVAAQVARNQVAMRVVQVLAEEEKQSEDPSKIMPEGEPKFAAQASCPDGFRWLGAHAGDLGHHAHVHLRDGCCRNDELQC